MHGWDAIKRIIAIGGQEYTSRRPEAFGAIQPQL